MHQNLVNCYCKISFIVLVQELTFDYGVQGSSEAKNGQFKECLCKSENCQGNLPFHRFAKI